MLKKTIDNMIDTGQMLYLINTYFPNTEQYEIFDSGPSVLSMSDLEFGFVIWVVCCCVSLFGFVIELFYKLFQPCEQKVSGRMQKPVQIDRPTSNIGTDCENNDEQSDEAIEVDQGESDSQKTEEINEHNDQEAEYHHTHQINELDINSVEHPLEVYAEVHQTDEMEESLIYFEAIIDNNERQQSASHATDLPEAIPSFMAVDTLNETSNSHETIKKDLDKN
jgi:hypothetical protein